VCVQVARRIGFEHKDNPIIVRTQRSSSQRRKETVCFVKKKKKKRNCVDERKSYMESNKPPFRCGQAGFVGITPASGAYASACVADTRPVRSCRDGRWNEISLSVY
jgi:hypothetical protein